jgi:cell division ATPase FtsA
MTLLDLFVKAIYTIKCLIKIILFFVVPIFILTKRDRKSLIRMIKPKKDGMFKSIFAELKIMVKGFICANLAEGLYLFDAKTRDKYSILVDVGYITTNVAIFRGNGLLSLNSFSLGGGFITADLSECLKISFNDAERIKHKIVLGWKAGARDVYEVEGSDGYIQTYSASAANEIATDRIEMICDYIQKCFDSCVYALPEFLPVNITGGGFNFIKGIKPIIANKLKRKINLISPSYPNINGPDYSSEVGLLHLVLESEHQVEEMLEV